MNMVLNIGYLYPDLLNLYGDNGNVEILAYRARKYEMDVTFTNIDLTGAVASADLAKVTLLFMGGGPDSSQRAIYQDLIKNKAGFLQDYILAGKTGLYICGAYQMLGKYYKDAVGSILNGVGVFDLYTEHFGKSKPRCIGNTSATLNTMIFQDPVFPKTPLGNQIVGFENHGGRTFLGESAVPLAKISKGHGNNSKDGTEGIVYKNSFGTYFHGPFLSKIRMLRTT